MEGPAEFLTRTEILDIFRLAGVGPDAAGKKGAAKDKDKAPAAGSSIPKEVGARVWFKNAEHNEADQDNVEKPFYQAKVLEDKGAKCSLQLWEGEACKEAKFLGVFEAETQHILEWSDMAQAGISDMIEIDELNHATILWNLHQRYFKDDIYTYVGPTLLAVNPFMALDAKYPPSVIEDYKQIMQAEENYLEVMRSLPAHTYAVAAYAHKQLIVTKTRQAIVIAGESGAGKTEAAKLAMAFLTALGSKNVDESKGPLATRILSTNPVLEAFGNSRTARNDNSSRFGKYIKLYFDKEDGLCVGAENKNYLLEKSRVIGCTPVERNYHIFFFILRGAPDATAKRLGMNDAKGARKHYSAFRYLATCNDIRTFKDKDGNEKKESMEARDLKDYAELAAAFVSLGFPQPEIDAIHDVTAAALHCGELVLDPSTFDDGKANTPVSITSTAVV